MKKFIFLFILLFLASCTKIVGDKPEYPAVAGFVVSFADGENIGSEENRLPKESKYSFHITIKAIDANGDETENYNGKAMIKTRFSTLSSASLVEITDGVAENVVVEMSRALGTDDILVQGLTGESIEQGGKKVRIEDGVYGVSPKLYFPMPTVTEIQENHNGSAKSGFESIYNRRNFTVISADGSDAAHSLIVVAVVEGGFYLTDLGSPAFGSLYLYTHSTPYVDDGESYQSLAAGTILDGFNGSIFEFFGFTEMSFPTFLPRRDKDGRIVVHPELIPLAFDISSLLDNGEDEQLEAREASLVVVENVTVMDFDETEQSYLDYGQFPVQTDNGGIIMAATSSTVPTFNPVENKGKKLTSMKGVLKQHRSSRPSTWILVPRDENDIVKQDK
ncbi:hypothetical protein KAH37_01715 [bacterium]|nr:hypothetical protein [bacterium]